MFIVLVVYNDHNKTKLEIKIYKTFFRPTPECVSYSHGNKRNKKNVFTAVTTAVNTFFLFLLFP